MKPFKVFNEDAALVFVDGTEVYQLEALDCQKLQKLGITGEARYREPHTVPYVILHWVSPTHSEYLLVDDIPVGLCDYIKTNNKLKKW